MLPLFGVLGGTRDSTLGGRMCVLLTVGRKRGQPRELSLNYVPTTRGVGLLAGFGRFHLVSDERPPWVATAARSSML